MKCTKKHSNILIILSLVSAVLAGIVNLTVAETVLGLAGTQWVLVAIVLGIYAVYAAISSSHGGDE
ncbi:hypothetical protein BMS3Abin15_00354 [bacterium BMS3Abin15]|nr:hypothetical protein BMS3Abin15_00354 [bacterium BMS3Abin15]